MFALKHSTTNKIMETRSTKKYGLAEIPAGCEAVENNSDDLCAGDTLIDDVLTKGTIEEDVDSEVLVAFKAIDPDRDRTLFTEDENKAWDLATLLTTIKFLKERL